eukprot:403352565
MTNFNVNKEQFQTINESLDYIDKKENPYSFPELPKMLQPGQGNMQQAKNNENVNSRILGFKTNSNSLSSKRTTTSQMNTFSNNASQTMQNFNSNPQAKLVNATISQIDEEKIIQKGNQNGINKNMQQIAMDNPQSSYSQNNNNVQMNVKSEKNFLINNRKMSNNSTSVAAYQTIYGNSFFGSRSQTRNFNQHNNSQIINPESSFNVQQTMRQTSTLTITRDINEEGIQMLESRKLKKQSEIELKEMESKLKVLEQQDQKIQTRNKLKEKIANQYFTIRVKSDKEQSERRTIIQRRKQQEELYKRENVEKLKHQWQQDIIQAKIKFQRQKYKQIQEKRGQDLMYYFEASQDTKKKDLKKFNLNDSKIAQLYSISRDKYLQSGKTFKEQGGVSPGMNHKQQQMYDLNFKDQMSKKVYQAQIELNHEETILNKKKIEQLRQLEEQMRQKIEEKKRVQQEIMFQRNNQSTVLSQNTSTIQKQATKLNQNWQNQAFSMSPQQNSQAQNIKPTSQNFHLKIDNFSIQDINFDQKIYQDMNSSILKSQNKSTSNRYNTDSIGQINSQESRNKIHNKFEEFTYEDENEQESDDNKQVQDRLQNDVKKLNQDSEEEEYEDDDYEEQDDQFEDDDKQSIKPQQTQQIQQTSLEEPSFTSSVGNNNSNFLVIQHNPGNSNSQSTDQNSHKKSSFNIVNYKKNNEKDSMIKDTQHYKINQSMSKSKQQPEQNNAQHQKKVSKFVNKDIQSSLQMPAKANLKIEQGKNAFTSKDKNEVKRQIQSIDIQNKEQIEQSSQNYDGDSSFQREQIPQQVKTDSQAISKDSLMSNDNDLDSDRDSNDDDLQEEDSDQDYSIDDDQFYKENSDDHQSNNTVLQSTSQHILKSKNAHKASVESNLTKTNQEGKEKGKTGIIIKHISKLDDHDE